MLKQDIISNNKHIISNKTKKILIVDDIGFNIQALQIILKYFVKISVEIACEKALNG